MRSNKLLLGDVGDYNHGLWYSPSWLGERIDGPLLMGFEGGMLGTKIENDYWSLMWRRGQVIINRELLLRDFGPPGGRNLIIGDDVFFSDIDMANIVGLYGLTDQNKAGLKLGSTGPLLFGTDNKLGIGTPSPDSDIHIINSANPAGITMEGVGSTFFNFKEKGFLDRFGIYTRFQGTGDGNMFMITASSTGDAPRERDAKLTITQSGKVGIGTNGATERLHVYGNIRLKDDSNILGLDILQGYNDLRFRSSQHNLIDMIIKDDGDVGIGTENPDSRLHVHGSNGSFIARFENTNAEGGDGVAIMLHETNGETDGDNHFVAFMKGNGTQVGRIQGYQYNSSKVAGMITDALAVLGVDHSPNSSFSKLTSLNYQNMTDELRDLVYERAANISMFHFHPGSLPSFSFPSSFSAGSLPSLNVGDFSTSDHFKNKMRDILLPYAEIRNITDSGLKVDEVKQRLSSDSQLIQGFLGENPGAVDLVTAGDPWGLAIAAMSMEVLAWAKDDGVSYMAVGADYAEWLPKKDTSEQFLFGQIVGVKNGEITKDTQGADQIMVISHNPIVLGNMIPKEEEHLYEKVGFMGQVPVHVMGKVREGDYIIASDLNNGFGFAVSPEDIELHHFQSIVGRAWSDNDLPLGIVNVAIGLKTNEWVSILEKHEMKFKQLESRVMQMERNNDLNEGMIEAFHDRLTQLEAMTGRKTVDPGQKACITCE